jgi:N-acetyl-gamma-glutamyl-phosphate reductase
MIKTGIIGGAGYTAGEMLRILLNHPQVEISFVHSKSNAGNSIASVHQDLLGETDLKFSSAFRNEIDVLFLCLGHGQSKVFLEENPFSDSVKIIDLSQDYRLGNSGFVYGLPELNKTDIQKADKIANPGCFATAIQLALLPLAKKHLLREDVHINAVTGSTGAGQSLSATSHFSWRNNNVSIYKTFTHQHLKEIRQSLQQLQEAFTQELYFIPVRGNFTRGILATAYTRCDLTLEEAKSLYREFYQDHPFTIISDENPALKQVVNTNKCILHLQKHENMLLVVSIIDNLVKGASGQAVQNMNLMFGLEESEGLRLKPVGF